MGGERQTDHLEGMVKEGISWSLSTAEGSQVQQQVQKKKQAFHLLPEAFSRQPSPLWCVEWVIWSIGSNSFEELELDELYLNQPRDYEFEELIIITQRYSIYSI